MSLSGSGHSDHLLNGACPDNEWRLRQRRYVRECPEAEPWYSDRPVGFLRCVSIPG